MKVTLPHLRELKIAGTPIVMVTAYDLPSARIVDSAGVDLVLVGDSAANTVLGHDPISTVRATMDELVILTRAVSRGCEHAMVIGDLPFMSYQVSDEDAVRNAGRFVKDAGADCVKLEGSGTSVTRAAAIVAAGIPVMAAAHSGVLRTPSARPSRYARYEAPAGAPAGRCASRQVTPVGPTSASWRVPAGRSSRSPTASSTTRSSAGSPNRIEPRSTAMTLS